VKRSVASLWPKDKKYITVAEAAELLAPLLPDPIETLRHKSDAYLLDIFKTTVNDRAKRKNVKRSVEGEATARCLIDDFGIPEGRIEKVIRPIIDAYAKAEMQ
jgi:hypothetical protein